MPMYRASAPFLKGDKGDRRVTGIYGYHQSHSGVQTPSLYSFWLQPQGLLARAKSYKLRLFVP